MSLVIFTYDEITGRNLNITGVSTLSNTLQVGTGVTVSPDGDVFATGVTTSTSFVGDLTGDVTGDVTGTCLLYTSPSPRD